MERRRWLGAGDHLIRIDVTSDGAAAAVADVVVVVEPLYGSVAVALALDAGWPTVEIASDDPAVAPIPLVSFEQRPVAGAERCRIRSSELAACVASVGGRDVLLGAPVLARPLTAQVAMRAPSSITFVACPSLDGSMAADSWWACGMLVRVLLEELDDVPSELTDAAGIAVTLAQGAELVTMQLSAGARWRRHLARGGSADDLRVAGSIDHVGTVPVVARDGDALIARSWLA